jgi:hypothetical protein
MSDQEDQPEEDYDTQDFEEQPEDSGADPDSDTVVEPGDTTTESGTYSYDDLDINNTPSAQPSVETEIPAPDLILGS